MSVIIGLMDKFWSMCAKKDAKLHATQTEPQGIKRICDIPYIDDGDRYHLLDVYYPEGTDEPLPVIIDIHGGGWMYADKELNKMYCLNLAKRGFTVFNISYRLVPCVSVNEQLQDVMSALAFIQANLSSYPCDKESIMLTGDSAGGQLAAYAAVLMSAPRLRGVFEVEDSKMKLSFLMLTSPVAYMNAKGIMSIYTRIMWGKDYKQKPTYKYMNLDEIIDMGTLPVTYMITSSGDFLAQKQTHRAAKDFAKRNIPVSVADFPKYNGKHLPHVFSVLEPESPAGIQAIDGAIAAYRRVIEARSKSQA